MVLLENAPSMIAHVIMPIVSVATVAGTIAAGITLGITIAQLLENEKVVLASSATIVLNRFIPSGVVPFYADPSVASMDVVGETKAYLKTVLGNNFVNVELVSFSPTPEAVTNVTDHYQDNQTTTWSNSTTTTTTVDNEDILPTTIELPTTPSIASTNRTSIIVSKMVFYFLQPTSQPISIPNLMITLSNLRTPIALFRLNGTADARPSSLNNPLSKVDPPKTTTLNAAALAKQPSISPALALAITAAASAALNDAGLGYLAGSTTSYPMG